MKRLSIIIPVYNVEEYLKRCIDSVLDQKLNDKEIILVNDGSNDKSPEICDEYMRRYPNIIRVIHKENAGLSAARNSGIDLARGKYIVFIDSDDFILPNTLEKIVEMGEKYNSEIIAAEGVRYFSDGRISPKSKFATKIGEYTGVEFIKINLKKGDISFCAPFYIYKKSYLIDNNYKFKEGLLHEDELWTPIVLLNANKVFFCGIVFYYHFFRVESITQSKNKEKNAKDIIKICLELSEKYNEYKKDDVKYLRDRIAMLYMHATYIGRLDSKEEVSINKMFPLKNTSKLKTAIKAMLFSLSPSLYCNTNKLAKKYRRCC